MKHLQRVPNLIRDLPHWMCWRLENGNKIPRQVCGDYGKSNDPKTWTTFDTAAAAADNFSGVAFVFTGDDGLCGIDLDACIDSDGVTSWAWPILNQFDGRAYAEISPSGTGIKLITQATKPSPACVHKIGPKKQQVEVYDQGRFWAITGDVYASQTNIRDGQAAVDWLYSTYFEKPKPKPKPKRAAAVVPSVSPLAVHNRAAGYIDSVPTEADGNRNNSVFKLAGHLRGIEEDGQRLAEPEVLDYCRQWNARCNPPLDDEELKKAIDSSARNGTPPAPKPSRDVWANAPQVDLTAFVETIPDAPATQTDGAVPVEIFNNAPGLLGDVYRWIMETSQYPLPEVTFASSLALLATITGHKIRGDRNTRTNVYLVSVAPTGAGKDHPRTAVQQLLNDAGGGAFYGNEDLKSGPGVMSMLAANPVQLCSIDEMGKFLSQVMSDRANSAVQAVASDLLKLYSSSGRELIGGAYADATRTPRLDQPHLVINGTTTGETLWTSLTNDEVFDGLIGRLQIFEALEYVPFSKEAKSVETIPPDLVARVRYWLDYRPLPVGNIALSPTPTLVGYDADAMARLQSHLVTIADRRIGEDRLVAAMWSRSGEKAHKLALIAAASCGRFRITLDDVNWAIRLQNALTRKLLARITAHVATNAEEGRKKEILRILSERTKWSKSQFTRRTQHLTKRDRDAMLEDLVQSGHVEIWQESPDGAGRPGFFLRLT